MIIRALVNDPSALYPSYLKVLVSARIYWALGKALIYRPRVYVENSKDTNESYVNNTEQILIIVDIKMTIRSTFRFTRLIARSKR
ncbi:hypothetical protein C9J48_05550 [Photobacterium profundum]|uniref:Uncharacterized protein n=1 Tax=Photobacterium profundum 3TCK TaxID=314280 RepID=Q1Z720_9GAMM|nr:hypothetical protein P3TCK_06107 [Photobacterium profundum 3TCK]PSV62960.1 hypothetical protein C9J48_05550 [Photobacterium profundum]